MRDNLSACYVRLSSEVMDLSNKKDLTNKYMHLTNNAIQELGKNYSIQEEGNIISIPRMEEILKEEGNPVDFEKKIWPQICEGVRISTLSCAHLLNVNKRSHCFEVYGYDFMIDSKLKAWMIEINTNPSLSESNDTVKTIIERMFGTFRLNLDDAFKITIDKIFKPKKQASPPNINILSPPKSNSNLPISTSHETKHPQDQKKDQPGIFSSLESAHLAAAEGYGVPKVPSFVKQTAKRSSHSAKTDFRISAMSQPIMGNLSRVEEPTKGENKAPVRRRVLTKKLTEAYSPKMKEQEKEDQGLNSDANEAIITRTDASERIFYKEPSLFPLSYKDNHMNLW